MRIAVSQGGQQDPGQAARCQVSSWRMGMDMIFISSQDDEGQNQLPYGEEVSSWKVPLYLVLVA